MRRPVVLLDVDGVCADFVSPIVAAVNEIAGTDHTYDSVDQWEIMTALGVSKKQGADAYDRARSEGFCRSLKPYPGAVDGVKALREFCDVHPVTAPFDGPHWIREREQWIGDVLGIPRHDIVHTHAKHLVDGDILIEDKTVTLATWCVYQFGIGLLMDRPWNAKDNWHNRVSNWDHLVATIQRFVETRRKV